MKPTPDKAPIHCSNCDACIEPGSGAKRFSSPAFSAHPNPIDCIRNLAEKVSRLESMMSSVAHKVNSTKDRS